MSRVQNWESWANGVLTGKGVFTIATTLEQDNSDVLTAAAQGALAANRAYLAKTSLVNLELVAQVKSLTQQNQALIRLVLGLLDATS